MDDKVLDDFCECLDPKFVLEVESPEALEKNIAFFSDHEVAFIQRMTKNYYELRKSRSDPKIYYGSIRDKLWIRMYQYFDIHKDFILYRKNRLIRTIPVQNDDFNSEAANALYHSLMNVINHLEGVIKGDSEVPPKKSKVSRFNSILDPYKRKRVRIPTAESFVLAHSNVNLEEVFRILSTNNFIVPDCHDSFAQAFSGHPVTNKVVWHEANSLQYFIKEIYSKGGIEKTPEGKWVRTIKCFKKPDGDYEVGDLQNTHEPVAPVTLILDRAIELINNPR
jgi:hypothetical protein